LKIDLEKSLEDAGAQDKEKINRRLGIIKG